MILLGVAERTGIDRATISKLETGKIANPTILARISNEELDALFRGYGWTPCVVEGDDPAVMRSR